MTTKRSSESVRPSVAVVNRVAAIEGIEPTDLPTLYEAVDPDALDALVESTSKADSCDFQIEFPYHGYEVTVTTNGVIHIDMDTAN